MTTVTSTFLMISGSSLIKSALNFGILSVPTSTLSLTGKDREALARIGERFPILFGDHIALGIKKLRGIRDPRRPYSIIGIFDICNDVIRSGADGKYFYPDDPDVFCRTLAYDRAWSAAVRPLFSLILSFVKTAGGHLMGQPVRKNNKKKCRRQKNKNDHRPSSRSPHILI